MNQAYLQYRGLTDSTLRGGRQRILLDNQRFVGGVGWRQNEQTYDGIRLMNDSLPHTTFTYTYIDNINRIFGPGEGTPAADSRPTLICSISIGVHPGA